MLSFRVFFCVDVRGQSNTGVNDAQLNGNYAIYLQAGSGAMEHLVRFCVRRQIHGGRGRESDERRMDSNGVGADHAGRSTVYRNLFIGADNRGVMSLNISGGSAKWRRDAANGNAQFIEFDASGGAGTIGSGTMKKPDISAYSAARITGDYAFGAAGSDNETIAQPIEAALLRTGQGLSATQRGMSTLRH